MALTTYAELQSAVASWANRTDLTTTIVDCIRLFEARANRELRVRGMENTLASTALVSGAVSLPTGFLAFKELRYDGDPAYTLQPKSLEWIRNQQELASQPFFYAVSNTQVVCWPQTGNIEGTYYKEVPALASNSTNWLLTSHPDVYLFGSLLELALFTEDMQKVEMYAARTTALLDQIKAADDSNAFNGGPLAVLAR